MAKLLLSPLRMEPWLALPAPAKSSCSGVPLPWGQTAPDPAWDARVAPTKLALPWAPRHRLPHIPGHLILPREPWGQPCSGVTQPSPAPGQGAPGLRYFGQVSNKR